MILRWFRKKPNPAATADREALDQAIRILANAKSEYAGLDTGKVDDPVWRFIWHAQYMLQKQQEEAFRYVIGDKKK